MSSATSSVAVAVSASTVGRPSARQRGADLQEGRAEVVAPLRDAVRLVDHQQAGRLRAQQLDEAGVGQPLGGGEDDARAAVGDGRLGGVGFLGVDARC